MGCTDREYIARAECASGFWTCERGVRHDLCCSPLEAPEQCPEWGEACTPALPCDDGYTCVKSRTWPLPNDEGVCRLGDWSIPEPLGDCGGDDVVDGELVLGLGTTPVKLEGVVTVEPVCNDLECESANPCCQTCMGSYVLDVAKPDALPMPIPLRTETVSCVGTNCGFTCSPMQPGRRYRVWGLWIPDSDGAHSGALYVAGSCAN